MIIGYLDQTEWLRNNLASLEQQGVSSEILDTLQRIFNYPHNLATFIAQVRALEPATSPTMKRMDSPKANCTVKERYWLICKDPIARGGMGAVYPFWDTQEKCVVAMKIALTKDRDFPAVLQNKVLREGEVLRRIARLKIPHIVRYLELGVGDFSFLGLAEAMVYLAMEYVEGRTLHEYRLHPEAPVLKKNLEEAQREGKKFYWDASLQEVLRYFYEIASALEQLHRQGLVHRDVKPTNILITRGKAILIDFGIAQRVSYEEGYFRTILTSNPHQGTTNFMDPGILDWQSFEKLSQALDDRQWSDFQASTRDLSRHYPQRLKPLKQKIRALARKVGAKAQQTGIREEEWEELGRELTAIWSGADPVEDVYSLGATMFFCLTGKALFENHFLILAAYQKAQSSSWWQRLRGEPQAYQSIALHHVLNATDFQNREEAQKTFAVLSEIIRGATCLSPARRWTCRQICQALQPLSQNIYGR